MRKKQFIILVIILAACLAAYFGMRYYNAAQDAKEAKEEAAKTLHVTDFTADDVTEFSYQYETKTQTFIKKDNVWYVKTKTSEKLDQDAVKTLLDSMGSMTSTTKLSKVSDTSQYGLDSPYQVMTVKLKTGKTLNITFGSENSILTEYYCQVTGDDNIYLVSESYLTSTLNKSVDDLKKSSTSSSSSSTSSSSTSSTSTASTAS